MPLRQLTIQLSTEELERIERAADYWDETPEQVLQWTITREWGSPRRPVRVELTVPASELSRWSKEARRQQLRTEDWVRRLANLALAAGLSSDVTTAGERAMVDLMTSCVWCSADLPGDSTIRRMYCSDRCRVLAWRDRRRSNTGSVDG